MWFAIHLSYSCDIFRSDTDLGKWQFPLVGLLLHVSVTKNLSNTTKLILLNSLLQEVIAGEIEIAGLSLIPMRGIWSSSGFVIFTQTNPESISSKFFPVVCHCVSVNVLQPLIGQNDILCPNIGQKQKLLVSMRCLPMRPTHTSIMLVYM